MKGVKSSTYMVIIHYIYLCSYVLGPFVMNTEEEIKQALLDYELGQNGLVT
jgi:redox-sensitive bicupin YhaK (pirin superfamily)